MSIGEQISNVGSEVSRVIRWKNRGNEKRKEGFCLKAIEYLNLSIEDSKNIHRVSELNKCNRRVEGLFFGR